MNNHLRYAQERLIAEFEYHDTKLKDEIKKKKEFIKGIKPKAAFYLRMQKVILENPAAMEAWRSLILVIKLSSDEQIQGITS